MKSLLSRSKPSLLFPLLSLLATPPALPSDPPVLWTADKPEIRHSHPELPPGKVRAIGQGDTGPRWRVTPPPPTGEKRNLLSLHYEPPIPLRQGEWIQIELRLRAVEAQPKTGGQAGFVLSLLPKPAVDAKDAKPFFQHILVAGEAWESFRIPVRVPSDFSPGAWRLRLGQSFFEQGVEIEGLRIVSVPDGSGLLTAAKYRGHEPDAPWREEAARRIKNHRMADLALRIMDEQGNPVPGATVTIEQQRHAYLFGTCVVAASITDAEVSLRDPEMTREQFLADNTRYRGELLRLFNFAVFENDLKWPLWAGQNPNFTQQATMDALQWLRAHQFAVKGHTLLWASWRETPPWLRRFEKDPAKLQQIILRHIEDISRATGPMTHYWDVLNEPMSHRDLIELLGEKAVAEWFQAARRAMPHTRLVINEFDIVGNGGNDARRAGLLELIEKIRHHDGPVDVVGFQSHFWSDRFTPPERVWAIIDDVHARTGLPVMVSEFDTNFPNEQLQADYTRDFLTAWFAHPATEAFIMWGFFARAHWFGEAGAMFRADWTPKPNLAAYTDLVFRDWWTRAQLRTDDQGRATQRAFLGTHRVKVAAPGRTTAVRDISLGRDGLELPIVLNPAPPTP